MPLRSWFFPPARKIKRLDVEADMFLAILKGMDGKRRIRSEGFPAEARCVGITVDERFNTVTLWLESPEWEEIGEGDAVPNLDVRFTEHFDPIGSTITVHQQQ
jgi:hypothetical protein